ncbi:MAG: hypothetical protein FWD56_03415 [Bacteroidales bacterium]|nr:hypothetical protein [Bacteroidales bacterium]
MTKKLLFFSFLSMAILVGCNKSENQPEDETSTTRSINFNDVSYYLLDGQKIPVRKNDGKFYVMFHTSEVGKITEQLSKVDIKLKNLTDVQGINLYSINVIGSGVNKFSDFKSATIEGEYETVKLALSHTLYWAPYYQFLERFEGIDEFGITNLFYVKLKSLKDMDLLMKLAKENLVELIGSDKFLYGWYLLACTNHSKGDALEMTNLFFESGLFENASTDVFGIGKIH